ncbi:uncharacterized protein [Apostichopus japonicus]|uniref:uncharacterized protein isoform X1 n=1 Tax=Stichopus japonicus TaxID=307972 RepID=UPI003AB8BDA9
MKLRPRLRKTSHLQAAINYCKEKTDHTSLTSCWIDDKQPENEEEATDSDVSDNSVVPAATNDSSSLENMSFCGLLKKHTQTDCNNKTDGKYSVSESDEDAHKPLQQRQGCPQRLSQCPFCSKTLAGSQLSQQKEIKNHFN